MKRRFIIVLSFVLFLNGCVPFWSKQETMETSTAEADIIAQKGTVTSASVFPQQQYCVLYQQDGASLYYQGEKVAGPYRFIEEIYRNSKYDELPRRFISDNGLIGYLSFDGTEVICEPMFTEAEEMKPNGTRVSEGDGYYYIDDHGTRITQKYRDGSPHFEHQGLYCRIMLEDGSWGVIDCTDQLIYSDYEMINPLPEISECASGVKKDGTAAILYMNSFYGEEPYEVKLEGMTGIGTFDNTFDAYAVVTAADGRKGIVDGRGDMVLRAEYSNIEIQWYQRSDEESRTYPLQFLIKCQKPDGRWETFIKP